MRVKEAVMSPGAEAAAIWEAEDRAARAAAGERGRREAKEEARREAARREAEEVAMCIAETAKVAAPGTLPRARPAADVIDGRSSPGILACEVKEVEELRAMLAVRRGGTSHILRNAPSSASCSPPWMHPAYLRRHPLDCILAVPALV